VTRRRWALLALIALVAAGFVASQVVLTQPGPPVAWAHLGTRDVHSLAFEPGSTDRLLFGHHEGILASSDGGRTWSPLAVEADAMGMRPAADGSIVIAGHDVLVASHDGGRTWAPITSDLPNLDIHAFARDPSDPARMWAYLAEGGVYETTGGGTRWTKVYDGHIPFMTAVQDAGGVALLGIEPFSGFARSGDGGRTWQALSQPEAYPTFGLAATPDGKIVVLGASDALLWSEDGGRSWSTIPLPDTPFAIAMSSDGQTIAVVTKSTDLYRSEDGGRTWPGP
jgi:photosystem II stability/assembly factor-like uncharacterized protein